MKLYDNALKSFEYNFFAYATLAIIGQSCLGSAAAMYILSHGTSPIQMIQLSLIVLICMSVNTSIFAQLSARIVFNLVIASVVSSVFFIIVNAIIIQ